MAQATHTPAVTRTEVVEVKPATVTLHLSMEEATALMAVCRRIGGDTFSTPRGHFDSINSALFHAGVQHVEYHFDDKCRSIYFKSIA